jgi:hydrogenase expression/formation protein HypC
MCISVPSRVILIQGHQAELDVLGARRAPSTLLMPEVQVGDYVLTSVGSIVRILDEDEAVASLALFQELMALDSDPGENL